MKHPSQWKEAAVKEISITEARLVISDKLLDLSQTILKDETNLFEFVKDLEALESMVELVVTKVESN